MNMNTTANKIIKFFAASGISTTVSNGKLAVGSHCEKLRTTLRAAGARTINNTKEGFEIVVAAGVTAKFKAAKSGTVVCTLSVAQ